MRRVLGIDFDNTVICYDRVFHRLGMEAGLVPAAPSLSQKAVREAARNSAEGDLAWQRLQGAAYGPRLGQAEPFPGVLRVLAQCHGAGWELHIISHKTQYASIDPSRTDLRQAAREWLSAQGFFGAATGMDPSHFHCGSSRQEKIALIRACGCTAFVDDLVETYREPDFPRELQAILFAPGELPSELPLPDLWVARTWTEIGDRLQRG